MPAGSDILLLAAAAVIAAVAAAVWIGTAAGQLAAAATSGLNEALLEGSKHL
jgi:hypothetical protein